MSAESRPRAAQKIQQGVAAWERSAYLEALEIFNEVLAEHPGYPDVHHRAGLCQAMLGELELVRAFVEADAAVVNVPGPHGIPLLAHAEAGGVAAADVTEYLRSLEAGDTPGSASASQTAG